PSPGGGRPRRPGAGSWLSVADHWEPPARSRRVGHALVDDLTLPEVAAVPPGLLRGRPATDPLRLSAARMNERPAAGQDDSVVLGRHDHRTPGRDDRRLGRGGTAEQEGKNQSVEKTHTSP
ncbi:MAG: hypothetical protein ACK55I_04865, partial [bacterium]